jgi:hypothetical protein
MNPTSSYTVPTFPQMKKTNDTKHTLYYSNYCKHSKALFQLLQKENILDTLDLVCIDQRFQKENVTYIKTANNQPFPLPPMINCVPTLCLMPNFEILTGNKIVNYFKPIHNNIEQERNELNMEPNPYSLAQETNGSFGVTSDNFSFYDSDEKELSASGNGGMRQMYNYAAIQKSGQDETIYTPQDEGKEQKLSMTLEQLQNMRNSEI